MYCRECGTKLDDNQKFCQNCGTDQRVDNSNDNDNLNNSNSSQSSYIKNAGYNDYKIDSKIYIAAATGLLGLIFLLSCPFLKYDFIELSFFDFLDLANNKDEYVFSKFTAIMLAIGPAGVLVLIDIFRIPRLYDNCMQIGNTHKAEKLLHNSGGFLRKSGILFLVIPIVFFMVTSITDSDDIKYLSNGFWLCSLCLVVEGILLFISEPPTQQYITHLHLNNTTTDDNWICPECDFNNSNNSKQCCNCGFENLPQSEQMWTCPYCCQLNDSSKSTCTNCGKFRG